MAQTAKSAAMTFAKVMREKFNALNVNRASSPVHTVKFLQSSVKICRSAGNFFSTKSSWHAFCLYVKQVLANFGKNRKF